MHAAHKEYEKTVRCPAQAMTDDDPRVNVEEPPDASQKFLVDALAKGVVELGDDFEAAVKQRERGNPKYRSRAEETTTTPRFG